jgi:hypothetical protein
MTELQCRKPTNRLLRIYLNQLYFFLKYPYTKTRPSIPAAQMMLAKVYLNMAIYDKAKSFADLAMTNNNVLLDFNKLKHYFNLSIANFQG